jgi:hypothetical protein
LLAHSLGSGERGRPSLSRRNKGDEDARMFAMSTIR